MPSLRFAPSRAPHPAPPRRHPSPPDRPDTDPVVGGSLTRFPRSPCGGDTCRDAETTRRTRRRESRVLSDAGEKRRGQLRSPDAKHDDRCQRTFLQFFSSPLSLCSFSRSRPFLSRFENEDFASSVFNPSVLGCTEDWKISAMRERK